MRAVLAKMTLVTSARLLRFSLFWLTAFSIEQLSAIQMVRIAEFTQPLGTNFPCGDANHNGRDEIYGDNQDSLIVMEYQGNNKLRRVDSNATVAGGPWIFGDGDNDGLMEVVGYHAAGSAAIFESQAPDSFPNREVWSVRPVPAANYPYPKFMDLDRDGRQEIAFTVENRGVCLYENSGNNQYDSAAVLTDTGYDRQPEGDFDVGDLDGDSLTELATGTLGCYLLVFEATGLNDQYVLSARCSTESHRNVNIAVAHDMDHDGWPELIADGTSSISGGVELMVYEAAGHAQYNQVWAIDRSDFTPGWFGNPISVGDVDGDGNEEFVVNTGWGVMLFKSDGPHSYSPIWFRDSVGTYEQLFDINRDGRVEVIFDGPRGTEIWEDTEGLGVAEFSKLPLESQVMATPSVARLGASLQFSGIPADAEVEVLALDGRLVRETQGVRQSTWTWNLRNQSGNLVPAGTYFAVIRSRGKSTSLKLCLVK